VEGDWNFILAKHARPTYDQANPSNLASEPELRQINPPMVTGFITDGSDESQPELK
jgi:hypothetical protein